MKFYRLFITGFSISMIIILSFYLRKTTFFTDNGTRTSISDEIPFKKLPSSLFLNLNESIKRIAAIDRIFLINLPTRIDRRTTSIAIFQKLHLNLHIVPAFHPQAAEVLSRLHHLPHHLTHIELACWASHVQLWTHITLTTTNDQSWTLIFEDDVDVELSMVDILESFPSDMWTKADMMYLGYCGNPRGELLWKGQTHHQIHRAVNPSCTHAYAIRTDTTRKLLNLLSTPQRPIDLEIVHLNNEKKLTIYSIHPPLAIQNRRLKSSIKLDTDSLKESVRRKLNLLKEWWLDAQTVESLNNSSLSKIDFNQAEEWLEKNQRDTWTIDNRRQS